jgi:hypothetical protein
MSESKKRKARCAVSDGLAPRPVGPLSEDEGALFNSAIASAVADRLVGTHYGEIIAAQDNHRCVGR